MDQILKIAKQRYNEQKWRATSRKIPFELTFEQWWGLWQQSGKWDQRGCKKGHYVMSRIGDTGAYSIDNVFIQLHQNNAKDGQLGKTLSPEHIQSIKKTMIGNKHGSKKRSAETCERIRQGRLKYVAQKKLTQEIING